MNQNPSPGGTSPAEDHATEEVHGDRPTGEATSTSTPAVPKSKWPKTRPIPKSTSELGAEAGTTKDNSVVDDSVTTPKPTRPKARRVPKSTTDVGAEASMTERNTEGNTEGNTEASRVNAPKPSRPKACHVAKSTTKVGVEDEGADDTDATEVQDVADIASRITRTPRRIKASVQTEVTTKSAKPATSPTKAAPKPKGKKAQTEDTDSLPEVVPKRATQSQAAAEVSSVATANTRPLKRKAGEFIGVLIHL
ncbi:hypothetical protein DENSPDRAFT_855161 [Dentipellis sp. KUC8613]|nr:hypothetical protein DENSPDRAFT_855161 [Dentipellis sp. KUC8613]